MYTNLRQASAIYWDRKRNVAFGRTDLLPGSMRRIEPGRMVDNADSPHKTVKDLI